MAIINLKPIISEEEQYALRNGKTILSSSASNKFAYIVSRKPEISQPVNGIGYSWDENGMSQLFAETFEQEIKYCPEAKSWFTYSKGAWRADAGAHLVSSRVGEFYQLLTLYCGEITDEELRKKFFKFVAKFGDRRFRDRLLKDAADNELLSISATLFDADPYLINCRNGTYDLRSMTFREHDWRDLLTMQTNFNFTVQDVRCERWEDFIFEVTQGNTEKAEYIQKAMGYSMLGTPNEECMFILHGKTTRNGKSTMLSAIDYLLGDYASVSPVSIICRPDKSRNAETANPVLASLKGKRLVTMAESNQYGKLDEEVIKQLTGGEKITSRNLYEKPTTWLPQFTMWLSCNDLPSVRDKSLFASDRIRVIEFNRHFSPEEQDRTLKTAFRTTEAMQGIFAWMIRGYFKYKRFGLVMPPTMQDVVNTYERSNDMVLQFMEEMCKREVGELTQAKVLYDAFKIWCRRNGYRGGTSRKFIADLEAHPELHGGRILENELPVFRDIVLK